MHETVVATLGSTWLLSYTVQFRENFWVVAIATRTKSIKYEGSAIIRSSDPRDAALRLECSSAYRGRGYAYACVSLLGWTDDPKIVFVHAGRVQGEG